MSWAELKEEKRRKRLLNKETSIRVLNEQQIEYTSRNDGVHIVIVDQGKTWDFWPATGRWCLRCTNIVFQRGVWRLINTIRKGRPK